MKIKDYPKEYTRKSIFFDEEEIGLFIDNYAFNGNLYIGLISEKGLADLTTNTDFKLSEDEAAVDTNNFPQAIQFIEDNKLGTNTGKTIPSGFCLYPVFKFDLDKLKEYQVTI